MPWHESAVRPIYTDRFEEVERFNRVAVVHRATVSKQRQSVEQLEDGKTRLVNREDDCSTSQCQSNIVQHNQQFRQRILFVQAYITRFDD